MSDKSFFTTIISKPEDGTIRYPLNDIIIGPYKKFLVHSRQFIQIASIFSVAMSAVYLLFGSSIFCNFSFFNHDSICSYNIGAYILSKLIILYLISAFSVRYYQSVWCQKTTGPIFLFRPQKLDIFSFIGFIFFILINMMSVLSGYLLIIRVPNPDWRIELTYFGFVSIGFLLPFILLRLYSIFADIWSGHKPSSLLNIWKLSRGNSLRLIISASMQMFLFIFSLSATTSYAGSLASEASILSIIVMEYIFCFVLLISVSLFINFCAIQQHYLNLENSDE